MLQRQQFNEIAKACRAYRAKRVQQGILEDPYYAEFVRTLTAVLLHSNPAFDTDRFVAACNPKAWD